MNQLTKLSFFIAIFWSITTFAYAEATNAISLKQLILVSASDNVNSTSINWKTINNTQKNGTVSLSLKNNETGDISFTKSFLQIQANKEGGANQIQLTIDQLGEKLEDSSNPLQLNHALYAYFLNQNLDTKLIKNTSISPYYSAGIYKISPPTKEDIWVVLQTTIINRKDRSLISIYTTEKDALRQYNQPFYG